MLCVLLVILLLNLLIIWFALHDFAVGFAGLCVCLVPDVVVLCNLGWLFWVELVDVVQLVILRWFCFVTCFAALILYIWLLLWLCFAYVCLGWLVLHWVCLFGLVLWFWGGLFCCVLLVWRWLTLFVIIVHECCVYVFIWDLLFWFIDMGFVSCWYTAVF